MAITSLVQSRLTQNNKKNTLKGINKALGGDYMSTSFVNGEAYIVHTFLGSGTFTALEDFDCEYLMIAGGGSGPWGGGGAGGYRTSVAGDTSGRNSAAEDPASLSGGTDYTITVGAGAAPNANGGATSAFGISCSGGGRGSYGNNIGGASGGSGGGGYPGSGYSFSPTGGGGGAAGQGHSGSSGGYNSGKGGGGGGAGGNGLGGNFAGQSFYTEAGAALISSIDGLSKGRAEGGAGYGGALSTIRRGGASFDGLDGEPNTGAGGSGNGGTGGSGIVIVRYKA